MDATVATGNKVGADIAAAGGATAGTGDWHGIMVFAESHASQFEPVTFELIGKARELAGKTDQDVICVAIGEGTSGMAAGLLDFGVDRVLVYDAPSYRHFVANVYAAALEDAVSHEKPSVVLIGATPAGRSLAPRVAVRFRTGLTADCTGLDIRPDGNLVQTRPAFGGNIMATILTKTARPQMATVRPKVMPKAERVAEGGARGDAADDVAGSGKSARSGVLRREVDPTALARHLSAVRVVSESALPKAESISEARIIVACGRGVRAQKDLDIFDELARRLGGVLAGSRPLVEKGWFPAMRQVGQSGRTVAPDLYIACGISGAIQHIAGMSGSKVVVAINSDKEAPIFQTANYALVGDMYGIVPELLRLLPGGASHV